MPFRVLELQPEIVTLGQENVKDAVAVLCDAFADYPVLRFVLGDAGDRARRIRRLIEFFTMARFLRGEPVLGVQLDTELVAVALISFPGVSPSPPELDALRESVWNELGSDARARYMVFNAANEPFEMHVPHVHLNMIGVRHALHGTGLGRRLMTEVHRVATSREGCEGVTLSTESPANVRFYERLGYREVGRATVAETLVTWALFRPNTV